MDPRSGDELASGEPHDRSTGENSTSLQYGSCYQGFIGREVVYRFEPRARYYKVVSMQM